MRSTPATLLLSALFQASTVEQLAARVRGEEGPWSPLVPIQPHGTRTPFFCVHAVGGNVLSYAELARRLGTDQPFYGLQSQGIDGRLPPLESLPEMAALYVQAVRTVQPHGPYRLGGWSMGGVIAYEMLTPDLRRRMSIFWLDAPPHSKSGPAFSHEGEDAVVVLKGSLKVEIGGVWHELKKGDSLYFNSELPHRWVNETGRPAQIMWISTPPSF